MEFKENKIVAKMLGSIVRHQVILRTLRAKCNRHFHEDNIRSLAEGLVLTQELLAGKITDSEFKKRTRRSYKEGCSIDEYYHQLHMSADGHFKGYILRIIKAAFKYSLDPQQRHLMQIIRNTEYALRESKEDREFPIFEPLMKTMVECVLEHHEIEVEDDI